MCYNPSPKEDMYMIISDVVVISHKYMKQIHSVFWSKVSLDPGGDWSMELSISSRPLCHHSYHALIQTSLVQLENNCIQKYKNVDLRVGRQQKDMGTHFQCCTKYILFWNTIGLLHLLNYGKFTWGCCVFWLAFGCCAHLKACQILFWVCFNLICWF